MPSMKTADIISLSAEEGLMGAMTGSMRRIRRAKKPTTRDDFGMGAEDWNTDIDGAMAEIAVAKRLGLLWMPGPDGRCDFSVGIEVKSAVRHDSRMVFGERDTERAGWKQRMYVLVTGRFPTLWVRGWILGADAAQDEWWQDAGNGRSPAWIIPATALNPVSTLMLAASPQL